MVYPVGTKVNITNSGRICPTYREMAERMNLSKWVYEWNDLYHHPEKGHTSMGIIIDNIKLNDTYYCGIDLGVFEVIISYTSNDKILPFEVFQTNIFLEDFLI